MNECKSLFSEISHSYINNVALYVFLFYLAEKSNKSEKAANQGPQFTSGVIMKITDNKPLPGRKILKVQYNSSASLTF